jgi:hypothetical protein
MPRPCYSTTFEQSADQVWSAIRDFGEYEWAGVVSDTVIEEGRSGDSVGCIRAVRLQDRTIRQQLLAHSDRDRFYSYTLCDPRHLPFHDFVATLRVTPVTDGDRAFVQWSAIFDCVETERDKWHNHLVASFRTWLESLRGRLAA